MVSGGFAPYRRLKYGKDPTKHAGANHRPWAIIPVLGLVEILQLHKKLVMSNLSNFCYIVIDCCRQLCRRASCRNIKHFNVVSKLIVESS